MRAKPSRREKLDIDRIKKAEARKCLIEDIKQRLDSYPYRLGMLLEIDKKLKRGKTNADWRGLQ